MRPWYKNLDWVSILLWVALVGIGLTAIYSATHGPAREFLLESVQQNFNRQLQWFGISAAVLGIILLLPARFIVKAAPVAYVVCLGLLGAALAFGREVNGAKSWLYIGPVGLQVAEIAKVGTVLAVTALLSRKEARRGSVPYLVGAALLILIPAVLVVMQNDTGTGLVFLALIPIMMFWSGAVPLPWMALAGGAAAAVYLVIVSPAYAAIFVGLATVGMLLWTRSKAMSALMLVGVGAIAIAAWFGLFRVLEPHQVDRLVAFDDPEAFRYGAGFHVIQAKAAIGSGGLFGKGFTNGTQTQLAYIPENSTDFIYCVIGEEFGFLGSMAVLLVFAFLLIRMAGLGVQAGFALPRLFIAGMTGIFLVHILINVGMTIGLMPVIGIPLPFISYGGSALLANTAMLAIALNLHAKRDQFAVYS
ncbi:FtsW/RodA/SpoVE family cell cycle protein [Rubrivirga marina]|uniref:Cell wall polymerase n=1 Tax=Rubrivirga marina TaxID=1196024 RepID=A0A271J596_9BACT|nr:FtsW/RodA/SpoVE family cell cycle protein [Rubrivirga marina]PAP78437.1 rod shape-determining protein RodA [Rubrivirga marina]